MALTKEVYELISELSQNEKYGLSIANGPTYELQTQLMLVVELKIMEETKVQPLINLCIKFKKNIRFKRNYNT